MNDYVITIARGFGSGGKTIGRELGKRLNIPCYEDEILKMASDRSGINEDLFHETNEKLRNGLLTNAIKKIPPTKVVLPSDKKFISDINLFNIQAEIIKSLALTESCIIIGKCGDYVLENFGKIIRIYIDAPLEACTASIVNRMNVTESEARRLITKTNKYRKDYYRYYTRREWTNPTNYDIFINSDIVGRENCVDLLEMYTRFKLERF